MTERRIPHPVVFLVAFAPLQMAVLYADAFFTDGERKHKAGYVPDRLNPMPSQRAANSWGYVLRIGGKIVYSTTTTAWFRCGS